MPSPFQEEPTRPDPLPALIAAGIAAEHSRDLELLRSVVAEFEAACTWGAVPLHVEDTRQPSFIGAP